MLIGEMEKWTRYSLKLDAKFRDGVARRMLGTLYVLAPASMLSGGDSEAGLELLEDQLARYPQDISNHLRLAEAYLALDDPEPASQPLCVCITKRDQLRPSERRLLERLIEVAGGREQLVCAPVASPML
jgi:hypothetical protein